MAATLLAADVVIIRRDSTSPSTYFVDVPADLPLGSTPHGSFLSRSFLDRTFRSRAFRSSPLRQPPTPRLAIPFLERLGRDLPLDQELRELAPLRLALERHGLKARCRITLE
jgi:hypothetical protein